MAKSNGELVERVARLTRDVAGDRVDRRGAPAPALAIEEAAGLISGDRRRSPRSRTTPPTSGDRPDERRNRNDLPVLLGNLERPGVDDSPFRQNENPP